MCSSSRISKCEVGSWLVFFFSKFLFVCGAIQSANNGIGCPNESINITCTLPATGFLIWEISNTAQENSSADQQILLPGQLDMLIPFTFDNGLLFQIVLTNITGGVFSSTLFTNTEASLLEDIIFECYSDMINDRSSIGIRAADPPSLPLSPRVSSVMNQPSVSLVTLQWDPPSDSGGAAVSYELTVSPTPLSGPVSDGVDTTQQITVAYGTPYSISIRAVNCAGNSNLTMLTIAICPASISPADRVESLNVPPVTAEGSVLTFNCNGQTITSNCSSSGSWTPDPVTYDCPLTVTCESPGSPSRGSVDVGGQSPPYTAGTTISYQCDDGLFPMGVRTSKCNVNDIGRGEWMEDPALFICSETPANCTVPHPPSNGTISYMGNVILMINSTVAEGTVLTYLCDSGLVLTGTTGTIECGNDGRWSQDPLGIMCVDNTPVDPGIAAIAGGVIGGVMAVLLFIIFIMVVILCIMKNRSKEEEADTLVEMSGLRGEYSELRHNGPRGGSTRRVPSPVVDEEGYNRITHEIQETPAKSEYSEVNLDSEIKLDLGADGYSKVSGEAPQRMPGYSALHTAEAPKLESVVYADLGSVVKPAKKKPAATASVDQHQVTYAVVDMAATKKLKEKAATLPAKPSSPVKESPDALLNLDQALIQLQPIHAQWFNFGSSLGIPETLLEQIQESKCDKGTAMTEILDSWIRGCSGQPTWRELADALKKINEKQLAQQLMTIYETGKLPVEVNLHSVPTDMYKYTKEAPPPIPSRSPTATDSPGPTRHLSSPVQSSTLPARPPKSNGSDKAPARPPKPREEPPVPPRPPKPPRDNP